MVLNDEGILKNKEHNNLIQEAIDVGEIGLGIWNMSQQCMDISEKITGLTLEDKDNFPEILETIAYEKDLRLAKNDLQHYLDGTSPYYRSSFRFRTHKGNIRWMLVKGKLVEEEKTGNKLLYVLIYDVTGEKLLVGNDPDTNLINRDFFIRKLKSTIAHHKKMNQKGGLIGIEVSNLRALVDIYDYDFGKLVIEKVSSLLKGRVSPHQEIAKFPNDYFVLLSKRIDNQKELEESARAINNFFEQPLIIKNRLVSVNVSVGITIFPDDSKDVNDLMIFLESAVENSQQHQRNSWTSFDKELSENLHRKFRIETEIPIALQENELSMVYQPQIDSSSNKVIGVEALLRWESKKLGTISPGEFIPIAETAGYMIDIGQFVIEETIKTARKWLDNKYEFVKIGINISPIELINPDFIKKLLIYTKKYEVNPSYIEIEITEGIYLQSVNPGLNIVHELIAEGFKIAVDDFGTGYSNFIFLIQAEMNTVKIDKSIIDDIMNRKTLIVIQGLFNFAHNLDYQIIAEGVETREQVDALSRLGCYNIQGYYYSKPVSAGKIEQLLKSS